MLRDQTYVDLQSPMPVDDTSMSSAVASITGETVVLSFNSSGTRTTDAGEAAGTAVQGRFANKNILTVSGGNIGTYNDSSISFTGDCFTSEVAFPTAIWERNKDATWVNKLSTMTTDMSNGQFTVNYRTGEVWGLKATTTSSLTSTSYDINLAQTGSSGGLDTDVNIDQIQGTEVNLDDAAFGVGTDGVLACGLLADETTPDSVDEGDIGLPRMTLNRRQIMAGQTLDDAAFGVGTEYANATGFFADETGTDSVDEGDIGIARMTLDRRQIMSSDFLEDAVFASGGYLSMAGVEIDDPTALAAMTEGDNGNLKGDLSGRLIATLGTQLDVTNDSVSTQPVEPSNINTSAAATSLVIKASAGTIYEVRGHNDAASSQYIQVHDAASLPADTAVPEDSFLVAADSNFSITFPQGKSCATGIVVSNSSTLATKTIGSADCWFSAEYL